LIVGAWAHHAIVIDRVTLTMAASESSEVAAQPSTAREVGAVICQKGHYATLQLKRSWELSSLLKAVEDCENKTAELHAIFIHIADDSDASAVAPSAGDLDALVEKIIELPQLVVGIAERSANVVETCILSACDFVLAAPDLCFSVTGSLGDSSSLAVPLGLIRTLGPSLLDSLPDDFPAGGVSLSWGTALDIGLVTEVFPTLDALQSRREDLSKDFQRGPLAAVAALRWASRRFTKGRVARGVGSVATACRVRNRNHPTDYEPATKRRRVCTKAQNSCDVVAEALMDGSESRVREPAATLLRHLVSGSLQPAPSQRESFQNELADLIGASLTNTEVAQKRGIDEVVAMLDAADTERALREGEVAAAESRVIEARCAISECKTRLRSETVAMREAAAALSEEEQREAQGNALLDEAATKKARLEGAEEIFMSLREAAILGPKVMKNKSEKLVTISKEFNFDDTLLIGLPGALIQKPEKRTHCDQTFIQAFQEDLQTHLAELDKSLREGVPLRDARAEKVQTQREKHDEARQRQSAASEALTKAHQNLREHESKIDRYEKSTQYFGPELRRLEAEADEAKQRLDVFRDGPLSVFKRLLKEGYQQDADAFAATQVVTNTGCLDAATAVEKAVEQEAEKKVAEQEAVDAVTGEQPEEEALEPTEEDQTQEAAEPVEAVGDGGEESE